MQKMDKGAICLKQYIQVLKLKQEIVDDLENYDDIDEDVIREICDSLVPVYNSSLIDFASHFEGSEFLGHLVW